ncbi:mechanosensitive ion channel domain-containing protein [Paraliomyxa miuraensis]|uniref:mechanosensitive ion channel domain-containing protein n=1 Tax=Paraliomyxa miuraensis TaxID=376150 RepID=UPI00224D8CD8|nr:mechanosensitive ion channel domain-containing protein [Paraliomyxa miuraensis]MCX4241184.1 mechanosensitive ion channel family protein [Paraliomyxa miuraensis]
MSTAQRLLGAIGDLAFWVLGGLLLAWLLRLLVSLVEVGPMSTRLRATILRFAPVVELTVAVAYVASAVVALRAGEPAFAWTLIALVGIMGALAWSSLYDLVLGVAFRVAQVCQVGDQVRVDDVEGRVLAVGLRALVLQTREGDEAVVPWGRVGRRTLRRTQSVSGAYVHAFVLDEPAGADFLELKRRVITAAMRCHWASAVHEAKVERRTGGQIEVSVYAHDADHASLVEAAVRRALAQGVTVGGESLGVPTEAEGEDPSAVMDLRSVDGPRLPPPPTWKG